MTKKDMVLDFLKTYGWAILSAIVVISLLSLYFNPTSKPSEDTNSCLKLIAKDLCEDMNMEFASEKDFIYDFSHTSFYCKEFNRSTNVKQFRFYEDELNNCRNKTHE
jgi:hypothetical protein